MLPSVRAENGADQSTVRNAEDCAWYLLATLYGVPASEDEELQIRNRRTWNRLMAMRLDGDALTALRDNARHPANELEALLSDEMTAIVAAFAERSGNTSTIPFPRVDQSPDENFTIDFSSVAFNSDFEAAGFLFTTPVDFSNAIFFGNAWFERATFLDYAGFNRTNFSGIAGFYHTVFSGIAGFNRATFSGSAGFKHAIFSSMAGFDRAIFSGNAVFEITTFADTAGFDSAAFSHDAGFDGATFSGTARFESTTFLRNTVFKSATFSRDARFDSTTFSGNARFESATFLGITRFINSEMKSETSFESVTFATAPPHFFGAKLHEGTDWHNVTWPPPPADLTKARTFLAAYERLKLEMDRLKKHQDELDFFALEMQSRRVLYGRWRGLPLLLYGCLCDHGRSYARPLYALLAITATGALALWPHFGLNKLDKAIGLSLANTFGILGFRKDFVDPETLKKLSDLLVEIAAAQTVVGAILLFLFGLAIRNRFRMK